jgi:hypothetical protein
MLRPAMWNSGSGESQRSPGSTPSTAADPAAAASRLSTVSSTGLGSPSVPEVKTMLWTATGSSSRRGSTAASMPSSGRSTTTSAPTAAAWARCWSTVRRVFSGTSAAPTLGAAWSRTANAVDGGSVVVTRPPCPTPSAASCRAATSDRSSSSA